MSANRLDLAPLAAPRVLSVSDCKNAIALGYIAVSVAPSFYLPPLFLLGICGLATVQLIYGGSPSGRAPYVPLLLLMLGFFVASALASGLHPVELLSYDAIRYDANVFYSILPLLVLGSGQMTVERVDRWIGRIALWGVVLYLAASAVGVQLFESHNAVGGFYMILLAYLIGRTVVDGVGNRRLPLLAAIVALLLSDSRGSIVAIAAALVLRLSYTRWPRLITVCGLTSVVVLLAGLVVCHKIWIDNGSIVLYDYSEFGSVAKSLSFDEIVLGERPGTVLHRLFFLYPMAMDMFLQSPLLGVGFTRFDDFPLQIEHFGGLIAFNDGFVQHTNLHAHNSYLHIAAETGLVGLGLLGAFLIRIFRCFRAHPDLFAAIQLVLASLLFASLTEHRLTTPSQAAPAFILVALLFAAARSRRGTWRAS